MYFGHFGFVFCNCNIEVTKVVGTGNWQHNGHPSYGIDKEEDYNIMHIIMFINLVFDISYFAETSLTVDDNNLLPEFVNIGAPHNKTNNGKEYHQYYMLVYDYDVVFIHKLLNTPFI